MGVYISGLEIPPKSKGAVVILCSSGAVYSGGQKVGTSVHVPPHGRLCDMDALKETIEALIEKHLHGYTKSTWDFVCELRSIISDAPTIIPAEDKP